MFLQVLFGYLLSMDYSLAGLSQEEGLKLASHQPLHAIIGTFALPWPKMPIDM